MPSALDHVQASADTNKPESSSDNNNLCNKYTTRNACIAGEQREGKTEGEAETVCGLAVTGCWTTWDKAVECGGDTYNEQPS